MNKNNIKINKSVLKHTSSHLAGGTNHAIEQQKRKLIQYALTPERVQPPEMFAVPIVVHYVLWFIWVLGW